MDAVYQGLSLTTWLGLSFLDGVGAGRLHKLASYLDYLHGGDNHANEQSLLQQQDLSAPLLAQLGWPSASIQDALNGFSGQWSDAVCKRIDQALSWTAPPDRHLLLPSSNDFPSALTAIPVAPTLLYVEGDIEALSLPGIGMVGARKASPYGREIATSWARDLATMGICPISGGAMGIDTCVHQGAIQAQRPTIAVMGTGLLECYPRHNRHLFEQIKSVGGALVSEYPLTTQARPHLFPPRNRIISGMSYGVIVVEATIQSGSLISARYALEHNREVMALPGRANDVLSSGSNLLIRQGAALVTSVEEVMAELPRACRDRAASVALPLLKNEIGGVGLEANGVKVKADEDMPEEQPALKDTAPHPVLDTLIDPDDKALVQILRQAADGLDFDALVRHTQWQAPALMQKLMQLELAGAIENAAGRYRIL